MDSGHIALFWVFAVVAFVIVTDERVAAAFVYVFKLANPEIKRHWWWLTNNPRNPVVKYMIYRRSLRIAKELMVEINKDKET